MVRKQTFDFEPILQAFFVKNTKARESGDSLSCQQIFVADYAFTLVGFQYVGVELNSRQNILKRSGLSNLSANKQADGQVFSCGLNPDRFL
jgi:hypothetical protein